MFEMENYKGLQFFHESELVNTNILSQMGYQTSIVYGLGDCTHKTMYFYHPEKPYVLAISGWNIGLKNTYYIQLIVSRDIFDKWGYNKGLCLSESNGAKKAGVYIGDKKYLVRTFLPKREKYISTGYDTLNIIDSDKITYFSEEHKKRNIIFPVSKLHEITMQRIKRNDEPVFEVSIIDKYNSRTDIFDKFKEEGFRVNSYYYPDYFKITKLYQTELEAWKAVYNYTEKYYQELKYNPIMGYVSRNFDIAYRYFMIKDLSEEDITKMALYDLRREWNKIVLNNLEELYKKYCIPFIGVLTDVDGNMVPDYSNKEEVEKFILN